MLQRRRATYGRFAAVALVRAAKSASAAEEVRRPVSMTRRFRSHSRLSAGATVSRAATGSKIASEVNCPLASDTRPKRRCPLNASPCRGRRHRSGRRRQRSGQLACGCSLRDGKWRPRDPSHATSISCLSRRSTSGPTPFHKRVSQYPPENKPSGESNGRTCYNRSSRVSTAPSRLPFA